MNYSLGKKKHEVDSSTINNNNNNNHCKLSATATASSTDQTNNNNNLDDESQTQEQIEIIPSTVATSSASRSTDHNPEAHVQHYNRINNNHVIAGVVAGPPDSPSGETVEFVTTVACGDECDASEQEGNNSGPCPSPVEVPTPTNDGNESPNKADVDTRIPVYV